MKWLLRALATVVAVGIGVLAVFVMGMRLGSPMVVDRVRRINRAVFNPRQMETAGTTGAWASVIRHRGRSSGAEYETPIGVAVTDDAYVVALPYGDRADWVKNVLAAGSATLVHDGEVIPVHDPQLVTFEEVADAFSAADARAQRVFGVRRCLRLSRAPAGAASV